MPDEPRPTKNWIAILSLAASGALLVLLHLYRPPAAGLWLETFFNSMHVPVFALVALGIFAAVRLLSRLRFSRCIALAMLLAMLLGVLSEGAQMQGPRDASVEDLMSDWLGSISVLLIVLAIGGGKQLNGKLRGAWAIVGAALMFLALWPLLSVSAAYVERNRNLPTIFGFDARYGKTFLRLQDATIEVTDHPTEKQKIGKVTFEDGSWPGLVFHDLWPDWSEYAFLVIELAMDGTRPLGINIRVHDSIHAQGSQPYEDRFNLSYTLGNGTQIIRIPLTEIRDAPRGRQMDLTEINGVVIFATRAEAGSVFDLAEIRLE